MSLSRAQQSIIDSWAKKAASLTGHYFRSVEYRFMDPTEVLSGAGAQRYGGRFAPVGTRAVYLSESDAGASGEVLARKLRLGGQAQISLEKYPRIVFAVAVSLDRVVDLRENPRMKSAAALRQACLATNDLSVSMEVGAALTSRRVQGVLFPSVVGGATNLVVYLQNCTRDSLTILNAKELQEKVNEMARRPR